MNASEHSNTNAIPPLNGTFPVFSFSAGTAFGILITLLFLIFLAHQFEDENSIKDLAVDDQTLNQAANNLVDYSRVGGGPDDIRLTDLRPTQLPLIERKFEQTIDDFSLKPTIYYDLFDPVSNMAKFYSRTDPIVHRPTNQSEADDSYYLLSTLERLDWTILELRRRESYLESKQTQYPGFDFNLLLFLLDPIRDQINQAVASYNSGDYKTADEHAFAAGAMLQRHVELIDIDEEFALEQANLHIQLHWLKALHTENNHAIAKYIQDTEVALMENNLKAAERLLSDARNVSDRYQQAAWLAKINPDAEPGLWNAMHWLLVDDPVLDQNNFDLFSDLQQFGSQQSLLRDTITKNFGCYVIIANNAYETYKLTRYSSLFPEMARLENRCGEDVTEMIAQQPVTAGSLNTARFKWALIQFHIGEIAD